ncbi:MAG: hypothetical protein HY560_09900 [Gemmatimonadetes bacterium]|nr:hypothetical protein [Gemmatimonadota bacterium]
MSAPPELSGGDDRRRRPRTPEENAVTALIEAILGNPQRAAANLERDLRAGGDARALLVRLETAEHFAMLRGTAAIRPLVGAIRKRMLRVAR